MTKPLALSHLSFRDVDENVLVHDPKADMIHVLNRPAGRILRLADGSRDLESIVVQFADESAIEVERAREDVTTILSEFRRLGLVLPADEESE